MEGTLSIGGIRAGYLIDGTAWNQPAIRDRCDQAMGKGLHRALSSTLSRWCDGDDPSLWIVRAVDIDIAANTVLPSEALSRDVARAVASSLQDALVGDGDGLASIRFP